MENQKKMSLFDLVFMSIGGIIGAGIFSMVGTGIATTGRSVALALIVGMIFTMSQQIRYIFTASMFQLSGGMYSQNALVLSPFLAGVSAVVTLVSSVSYSVFGISMAQYLGDLFPVLEPYQVPVACLVLIFFFIIASTGAQIFARAINALGILKFIALGLFIVFGFTKVQTGGFEGEPYFINGGVSFLTAVALMSFTCNGATNIINVQAIAENPKKNIPKAFFIASILVAGVYFLLGYVASGVAPYDQVAGQNLGYIAGLVLPGPLAVFFIVGGAMCSLSTALLGGISGMPFMIIGIAEDGWLPKFFTKKFNVVVTLAIISHSAHYRRLLPGQHRFDDAGTRYGNRCHHQLPGHEHARTLPGGVGQQRSEVLAHPVPYPDGDLHHHFADDQLLLADFADSAHGNRYCYCHHTDLCMDLVPHEEGLCQYYKYN